MPTGSTGRKHRAECKASTTERTTFTWSWIHHVLGLVMGFSKSELWPGQRGVNHKSKLSEPRGQHHTMVMHYMVGDGTEHPTDSSGTSRQLRTSRQHTAKRRGTARHDHHTGTHRSLETRKRRWGKVEDQFRIPKDLEAELAEYVRIR